MTFNIKKIINSRLLKKSNKRKQILIEIQHENYLLCLLLSFFLGKNFNFNIVTFSRDYFKNWKMLS